MLKSRIEYTVCPIKYSAFKIQIHISNYLRHAIKHDKPPSNDMTDNARIHQQSLKFSLTSGVTIYNFPGYQLINTLKKQEKMFKAWKGIKD